MNKPFIFIIGIFGGIILGVTSLWIIGNNIPAYHAKTIQIELNADKESVWKAITQYQEMPQWWPSVQKVERELQSNGQEIWWNIDPDGRKIPFITVQEDFPSKLIRKIADEQLPFGGLWSFELEETEQGTTQLTLLEFGRTRSPVFRIVNKWVIGYETTMRDFLFHLKNFVETTPQP